MKTTDNIKQEDIGQNSVSIMTIEIKVLTEPSWRILKYLTARGKRQVSMHFSFGSYWKVIVIHLLLNELEQLTY